MRQVPPVPEHGRRPDGRRSTRRGVRVWRGAAATDRPMGQSSARGRPTAVEGQASRPDTNSRGRRGRTPVCSIRGALGSRHPSFVRVASRTEPAHNALDGVVGMMCVELPADPAAFAVRRPLHANHPDARQTPCPRRSRVRRAVPARVVGRALPARGAARPIDAASLGTVLTKPALIAKVGSDRFTRHTLAFLLRASPPCPREFGASCVTNDRYGGD